MINSLSTKVVRLNKHLPIKIAKITTTLVLSFSVVIMNNIYWIFYTAAQFLGFLFLCSDGSSHNFYYELAFIFTLCLSTAILPFLYSQKPSRKILVLLGLIFLGLKLWAIHSKSFYEDDFYRYLVEARLLDQSLDPYLNSPHEVKNLILEGGFTKSQKYKIDTYQYAIKTGFGWMTAIYPPIVIQVFRLADNPVQLGYLFLISELIVFLCLTLLFKKIQPILWLWWLHPLPLIEVYLNKHYDLWIGLAVLFSLAAIISRNWKLSALGLALGVHLKGFALCFVPFMNRKVIFNFIIIYTFIESISYYSFPSRFADQNSLVSFAAMWEFNNGVYTWSRVFIQSLDFISSPNLIARLIFSSLLLLGLLWVFFRPNKQSVFIRVSILFFMFSPVTNPWYLLMCLPFFLVFSLDRREFHFFSLCPIYYFLWIAPNPMVALPWTTALQWFVLLYLLIYLPKSKNYGREKHAFQIEQQTDPLILEDRSSE